MTQIDPSVLSFEATKIAFGLVKDLNVQVLTLTTGLLGVSIVFNKDIFKTYSRIKAGLEGLILVSYLCSIVAGLFSLMGLIGTLSLLQARQITISKPDLSVLDFNIDRAIWPTIVQVILFSLGTLVLVVYVGIGLLQLWRDRMRSVGATPQRNDKES